MLHLPRALVSLVLLTGLAVFLIAQEDGCNSDENGEEADGTTSYSEEDVEYKLAVIDAGGFVDPNDPSIDSYAALLDSLETKCEEERTLISDQAVRATQLLADEGVTMTALEVLQGIDGSIPDESGTFSCAEVAAAWITLVVAQ